MWRCISASRCISLRKFTEPICPTRAGIIVHVHVEAADSRKYVNAPAWRSRKWRGSRSVTRCVNGALSMSLNARKVVRTSWRCPRNIKKQAGRHAFPADRNESPATLLALAQVAGGKRRRRRHGMTVQWWCHPMAVCWRRIIENGVIYREAARPMMASSRWLYGEIMSICAPASACPVWVIAPARH